MTKGTVYLYYTSKEVLFQAVVEDAVVPTISLGEQLLEVDGARGPDLFRALIGAWWDFMSAPPVSGIPKLLAAEAANFPAAAAYFVEHVFRRGRVVFRRVLELGIEHGEFRPDLDLENTARLALAPVVWALVHRHSLRVFDEQPLDLERFLAAHVDVFLRGIAARSQHGRG